MSPIRNHVSDSYAPLAAGSIARVAAASVISPVEMFRTRIQATSGRASGTGVFRDTLIGLKDLVNAQGYTSLWRGLTLTMWRDVPFSGIYWWGYETVRNALTDLRDRQHGRAPNSHPNRSRMRSRSRSAANHTATFIDSFIAGATSGAVASVVTTPFDVGKTRKQVFKLASDIPASRSATDQNPITVRARPEERSMPRFLYHIFRTEGVAGLFRGWVARCLKVAPACAIMISSYEIGKKMARNVNERREGRPET
jgi:solute carrier family 25 protein 39/40